MSDFECLVEREIPRLRRYARALTRNTERADDLVQETLLRAIAKGHLWQPGTDLRAWLFTIMHNQHVNHVRRSMREGVIVPIDDAASIWTAEPNADASLQLRDLGRAIAALPEEQRLCLVLGDVQGFSYEEIAEVMQVPLGTVKSRHFRGRAQLSEAFKSLLAEQAPAVSAGGHP